ncbi:hypothetical protein ACX6XY_27215 [Streptomyces sp. O3]
MNARDESQTADHWQVKHGDVLIGKLFPVAADQPWTVCRFEPEDGWWALQPLFEAQSEARRLGFPEDKVWAIKAVRDLGIELHPVNSGEVIRPMLIYITNEEATFRP